MAQPARDAISADLVAQIRLLLDGAQLPGRAGGAAPGRVRPSDIAVLVRSGIEAEAIQDALGAQGVPAVLARGTSVLGSPAAAQWRWLLEAVRRPSDHRRARTFALSWFGPWDAAQLAGAGEDELVELQDRLARWARTLTERGVADFLEQVRTESGVVGRVLARPDGDRALTDLDHVAELLHGAPAAGRSGVAGMLAALETDPDALEADADADTGLDLVARRIESDAQAVQIMTVWVAKGLEFPIVCVPTMWRALTTDPCISEDPVTGRRTYDLANGQHWPDGPTAAARKEQARAEAAGESLRLLYVALTRARHQTIVWWTRVQGANTSPLARVLFARDEHGEIDPEAWDASKVTLPPDDGARDALAPLLARGAGTLVAEVHGGALVPESRWVDPDRRGGPPEMGIAHLTRRLDRTARRRSFTAIAGRAEGTAPADPEDPTLADGGADDEQTPADDDEQAAADADNGPGPAPAASLSAPGIGPLARLPAGAAFGTMVHAVLEAVEFGDPDLSGALETAVADQLGWRALDLTPRGMAGADDGTGRRLLVAGLAAALATPLGPLFADRCLGDLAPADRLAELSFELRLGAGGLPRSDRDVGRLLLAHLGPDDPLGEWAAATAAGRFGVTLAGHLTGSIDAVLRVGDPPGARYVVVDYKTNRLGHIGSEPGPDDYGPAAMTAAMVQHHYPLQALLYSVALHRYLRWRVPDYDPAIHLGGVAYLFVRGMSGPTVPRAAAGPHGVWSWAVPAGLVTELSDLLDGRAVPA